MSMGRHSELTCHHEPPSAAVLETSSRRRILRCPQRIPFSAACINEISLELLATNLFLRTTLMSNCLLGGITKVWRHLVRWRAGCRLS